MKARNMDPDARLGVGEHLAYVTGYGGMYLTLMMLGSLLVFYTYVAGISAGLASAVLGVSKVFDGISDIIAGRIIDHTNSKYGKARPWIARMILPGVLSIIACFFIQPEWSTVTQVIYMFVTYNLASTVFYTMLGTAYTAFSGYMTMNQASRSINGAIVFLMAAVMGSIYSVTYLPLTKYLGGGEQYSSKGWILAMLLYGIVSMGMLLITVLFCRERGNSGDKTVMEENNIDTVKELRKIEDVSFVEVVKSLIFNKYWVIFLFAMLAIQIMQTVSGTIFVYFCDQILGDVNIQASLSVSSTLGMLVGVIIAMALMVKIGKRNTLVAGMVLLGSASLIPLISLSVPVCNIAMVLRGFGTGIAAAPVGSMVLDTLTYGQWKNGFSSIGTGCAVNSMVAKLAQGGGTVLIGLLLEIGGYVAGSSVQPAGAKTMIMGMMVWFPFIIAAVIIIIMQFYDLDKIYPQITEDLKNGKFAPEAYEKAGIPVEDTVK